MGYVYLPHGRSIWMMKYYRHGLPIRESSGTNNERKARKICRQRETDIERGLPITADLGKLRIDDAGADILADYANNDQRSADAVERRLRLHLKPAFRGWKMSEITTPDVRAYAQLRRARHCSDCDWRAEPGAADVRACPACGARTLAGAKAGTVNRELTILKRMFTLAVHGGKLLHTPYIPLLREANARAGFFEPEQFAAVRAQLPAALQPVVTFAYITGWRIDSEVLPLEWRQVDLAAGEVRLDPQTTKNDEPRVFPLTADLRAVLVAQKVSHDALAKVGLMCPWVFFRLVAKGRRGEKVPKRIKRFNKAWAAACKAAGCPGKIPHDFRRTAVRNMVRRGVPESVAMKLTGHKTRSVFERYNIVSAGDLADARAKLEGLTSGEKKAHGRAHRAQFGRRRDPNP